MVSLILHSFYRLHCSFSLIMIDCLDIQQLSNYNRLLLIQRSLNRSRKSPNFQMCIFHSTFSSAYCTQKIRKLSSLNTTQRTSIFGAIEFAKAFSDCHILKKIVSNHLLLLHLIELVDRRQINKLCAHPIAVCYFELLSFGVFLLK